MELASGWQERYDAIKDKKFDFKINGKEIGYESVTPGSLITISRVLKKEENKQKEKVNGASK